MSRFEKKTKILDRDTSLSVRGYVFEAFSLGICRFIPPYCFFGRKNVSRFEKTAEISNRDTFRETPPLTYASPRTYAPPSATRLTAPARFAPGSHAARTASPAFPWW